MQSENAVALQREPTMSEQISALLESSARNIDLVIGRDLAESNIPASELIAAAKRAKADQIVEVDLLREQVKRLRAEIRALELARSLA